MIYYWILLDSILSSISSFSSSRALDSLYPRFWIIPVCFYIMALGSNFGVYEGLKNYSHCPEMLVLVMKRCGATKCSIWFEGVLLVCIVLLLCWLTWDGEEGRLGKLMRESVKSLDLSLLFEWKLSMSSISASSGDYTPSPSNLALRMPWFVGGLLPVLARTA